MNTWLRKEYCTYILLHSFWKDIHDQHFNYTHPIKVKLTNQRNMLISITTKFLRKLDTSNLCWNKKMLYHQFSKENGFAIVRKKSYLFFSEQRIKSKLNWPAKRIKDIYYKLNLKKRFWQKWSIPQIWTVIF